MIAACPKCEARYRIEREKIGPDGVRLRCSKCQAVFRVRAPAPSPVPGPRSVAPPDAAAAAPPPSPGPSLDATPPAAGPSLDATPPAAGPSLDATPPSPGPSLDAPPAAGSDRAPASQASPAAADAPLDTTGSGSAESAPASPSPDAPLVLVGTPDEETAKTLRAALESWGLRAHVVPDGVEAMLEIQRQLPAAVLLAPTLPRMYGFQVCEIVKRNESLQRIGVILLGAIHHPDRYRRPPEELYGADAYVEEPDLPDGLLPELRQLGLLGGVAPGADGPAAPSLRSLDPAPGASPSGPDAAPPPGTSLSGPDAAPPPGTSPSGPGSAPPPLPEPSATPVAEPSVSAPPESPAAEPSVPEPAAAAPRPPSELVVDSAPPGDELSDARAQAERLARIIVSDIVLYNEEKFAAAIEAGNVVESLGPDLEEGRGLFRDRIDARIQDEKDFLTEELLRVARTRGLQ